jgi:hypothetical protein
LGDFGGLVTLGGFGVLDFRRGRCGLVLDFPTAARTGSRCRPLLADLVNEGLELDSEVVFEVEPEVSSNCWTDAGAWVDD